MALITGPRAVLEATFVLGDHTSRAYLDWSYKVISGAKVHKRSRHAKLAVGMDDLRHVPDSELILALLEALARAITSEDYPRPPAPPGGGVMGGEQLSLFPDSQRC